MSALQIANDLDINRSTLQRFIRGDGDIKLRVADKLADYLGVTAEFDGGLAIIRPLIRPKKLWSWRELRTSKTHPPASPGVYAWWFRQIPPGGVPTWGTERHHRYRLLYVGISPSKPSITTGKKSQQTVRDRLRYHFSGNIGGSTLRLTLASLLRQELKLKPVRTSNSLHLRQGEERLSEWMARWARVFWIEYERPWELEDVAIRRLRLPLNIQGNDGEEFRPKLKEARAKLKMAAK